MARLSPGTTPNSLSQGARLAEVEAQDRDETDLEDWLRALLDALADAGQRRHPR